MEKFTHRYVNAGKRVPVNKKVLSKYEKGTSVELKNLKHGIKKHHIEAKEKKFKEAEEATARAEILLTETSGLLEASSDSHTSLISQKAIRNAVDITSAAKGFDLLLNQYGPYKFRYSHDGRHMALGGELGHLACFDWVTKKLHFETNVMESIHDVCFLHTEKMVVAAQKEWTFIYDENGVETHCLKPFHRISFLEFLPHHLLLCGGNQQGFIAWVDVTLGQKLHSVRTREGRLKALCLNPSNGIICCGHGNGKVTMWSPNSPDAALQVKCQPGSMRDIAIDPSGRLMATTCVSSYIRIWDLRNLGKPISSYHVKNGRNHLAFSQTRLLATSWHGNVEILKDVTNQEKCEVYMKHQSNSPVTGLQFCPFEDVLGLSAQSGFSSILIPGSGEPNFDALEVNPYASKSFKREAEVKAFLEKIPHEMITLDPLTIEQVDVPTLEEKLQAAKDLEWVKAPEIDVKPRYRMKGKSGSANKFKRKHKIKENHKREFYKFMKNKKESLQKKQNSSKTDDVNVEILDRFKPKKS